MCWGLRTGLINAAFLEYGQVGPAARRCQAWEENWPLEFRS